MEKHDLDRVAELERELYPNPWRREHFAEFLALPPGFAWVGLDPAGEVVGYALAWVAADESEIANLAVARSWQRRGVGSRLLGAALHEARSRGARRAWLEVRASNAAAQGLYAGHGFHVVGRRKSYYLSPREDALVMSADLEEESGVL